MQTIQEPDVLQQPFCASGDKNTIPSSATGSQLASLAEGFPLITQQPTSQGGVPPERKDFNGAFNLLSKYNYAIQNGWLPTFKTDVSNAIGGYAEGACLWYMPTSGTYAGQVLMLKSLVANNTYDFTANPDGYIGTYWQIVTSAGGGLPSQTGQSGKFLTTNGTVASWAEVSGGADTALSNLTNTGKEVVANLSSPSPDYVDLTVPSTDGDTVTAPDDGYFVIKAKINRISDCAVNLRNTTNGQYNQCWCSFGVSAVEVATSIPVSKNDVVAVGFYNVVFNNASQPGYLRFIYANGTKHNKPAN